MFQLGHCREHLMYKLRNNHKCSKEDIDQQIDSQCNQHFGLKFCLCKHQYKQLQDHQ